jgi:hypothetical protein
VTLALGAAGAWGVGGALSIRVAPADVPVERTAVAASSPVTEPPAIAVVVTPPDRRVEHAATAVADALAGRGLPRPAVSRRAAGTGAGHRLLVRVTPPPSGPAAPEAFRLGRADGGDLTVVAGDVAGAAAGLYAVADRIRSGEPVLPPGEAERVVAPRLALRLTDAGSVGRTADPAAFAAGDDYSLNTDLVGDALLPRAPWVDAAAVQEIADQFRRFVDHALAQGYNGVVVPGFLEYVTFDRVGDGRAVYPPGDPHASRAEAMVTAFAPVFRYAADLGLRVYLRTDMLALSPPLERYLERTVGGLDTGDARLWSVYQAGLAELFDRMPFVSGLVVRIGEGGQVYAQAGWDLSSRIAVTTPEAVRAMLTAFLRTAAAAGKDVVFRTWTVGVGAVGDLHTNPASYEQVLGGLDDPHLVVSTKYAAGDFYSHLPLNPTFASGTQRRIVELQARREFEGFGALPNDLTGLHQQALQRFLAQNPRVEGVWNWTQDGGPLRAGPMSLYLRTGFWQLYDLNSYAAARLAWDPGTDPARVTADWARQTFSDDPRTVDAVAAVMAGSREAVTKGLYIAPYANTSVRALGLEPPPMMWIFEWDIVTGDTAALGVVYRVSRDDVDAAIADADRAVVLSRQLRDRLAATDPRTWRDPALRQRFVDTLAYQADLFGTLGAYRTMVLRHAQWLDTGSAAARDAWREATTRYVDSRRAHVARYGGNLDLPAYNFTAADLGVTRAGRDPAMARLAQLLLAVVLGSLLLGSGPGQRLLGRLGKPGLGSGGGLGDRAVPGAAALRGLWVGATRPWRLADLPEPAGRTDRVLVVALPAAALVASRLVLTWFAAPAHVLLVLSAWLLFGLAARLAVRGHDSFRLWAGLGGVALLRTVLLLAVLSVRGPGHYWLRFWTAPTGRSVYVTVAFAAFLWLFVVTALVLRGCYALSRRRALGATAAATGVPLALIGGLVAAVGLERALTVWNDQMTLLPWGLSRILGITVHLGIPTALPLVAAVIGLALVAVGAGTRLERRRPDRPGTAP